MENYSKIVKIVVTTTDYKNTQYSLTWIVNNVYVPFRGGGVFP